MMVMYSEDAEIEGEFWSPRRVGIPREIYKEL